MTEDAFERALRTFNRRKPFRPYLVEFFSGERIRVVHLEAIARWEELFYFRGADRSQSLFEAGSVCRVLDDLPVSG